MGFDFYFTIFPVKNQNFTDFIENKIENNKFTFYKI